MRRNITDMLLGNDLVEAIKEDISLSRDSIIKKCGYLLKEKSLNFQEFYENLLEAIDWNDIEWDSQFFYDNLKAINSYSTPTLDNDGVIIGRDVFIIAPCAEDIMKEWTEDEWADEECSDSFDGPFLTGNPNRSSKGYFFPHFTIENALNDFSGDLTQIIRPAYSKLTEEDEKRSIQDFLSEHGEHPKDLIAIVDEYNLSLEND